MQRCPSCQKPERPEGKALCPECWAAVPEKERLAHQRIFYAWKRHDRPLKDLVASLKAIAQTARNLRFGA